MKLAVYLTRGENASLQFKFAAIERHHLVNIRDAKLMHARAVILPNIDGVLTFGCDPCARHIRCLTDFEQAADRRWFSGNFRRY